MPLRLPAGLAALLLVLLGCASSDPVPPSNPAPEPPSGRLAYISNTMSHTVSVVDLDSGRTLKDLHLGRYPIFSALHPEAPGKLLVALHNYEGQPEEDGLAVYDLVRDRLERTISLPGASVPSGFTYDPRRGLIYLADEGLDRVLVLRAADLAVLGQLAAGRTTVHVALSPDQRWLVATNRMSSDLTLYDLESQSDILQVKGIPLPLDPESHPLDVAFGSGSDTCYVTDFTLRQLVRVDLRARTIQARLPLPQAPFDFALDAAKTRAYICLVGGNSVAAVDLHAWKVVGEIPGLTANPIHCALDETRNQLVVGCWGGGQTGGAYLLDTRSLTLIRPLPLPGAAASVGITLLQRP